MEEEKDSSSVPGGSPPGYLPSSWRSTLIWSRSEAGVKLRSGICSSSRR